MCACRDGPLGVYLRPLLHLRLLLSTLAALHTGVQAEMKEISAQADAEGKRVFTPLAFPKHAHQYPPPAAARPYSPLASRKHAH
eukprot:352767-Chlamydomonas_euryale.AAC.3